MIAESSSKIVKANENYLNRTVKIKSKKEHHLIFPILKSLDDERPVSHRSGYVSKIGPDYPNL